ncbi:MAG: nitrogen fixation-related uncharacterized protein [Mariniblastus sp.]|jgi:nitrogen fixation-related uncharacterized protein
MNQTFGLDYMDKHAKSMMLVWGLILAVWFLVLCFVPDPRPLAAPDWSIKLVGSATGLSEPSARAISAIGLRAIGMGLVGVLLALFLGQVKMRFAAPISIIGAGLLCIASQWINYGYFPIFSQVQLALASAILGALLGLTFRRSLVALIALVVVAGGLFLWGTSTGISDDLYQSARNTALHILENADGINKGDEGFAQLIHETFKFAEDNSHRTNAVEPNKAAILALGVILGEEKIATVAKRPINLDRKKELEAIRRRITIQGRNDLVRHFWVSAALTVLSDESRTMTVGITKELMDANPGGSGFSFVDLTADRAGTLFALGATRDAQSARAMQLSIRQGVNNADYFPKIDGLPEGISSDDFQSKYGGLRGEKTMAVVNDIQSRLATCRGLDLGR